MLFLGFTISRNSSPVGHTRETEYFYRKVVARVIAFWVTRGKNISAAEVNRPSSINWFHACWHTLLRYCSLVQNSIFFPLNFEPSYMHTHTHTNQPTNYHWPNQSSTSLYEHPWPSGLRRPTQVRFSSEAWVRILPDALTFAMLDSMSHAGFELATFS